MTIKEAINNPKDFIDIHLTCYGEKDTVAVSLDNVDVEAFHMAIKALQETRWIPVSEKLPKEDGDYLLWGKIDEDEDEYTFIGSYDSGCEEFGIWQEQFDRTTLGCLGSDFFEYASVIAWMPLPEPYKAKTEREE